MTGETLAGGNAYVTALPATPQDGMEIYYAADATNGVIWHLRYNGLSASAYKWEYVGGPPLFAEVETREALNSTTYAALTTAGPALTLPLAGDYDVEIGGRVEGTSATSDVFMSYDIGATGASDNDALQIFNGNTSIVGPSCARARRKTGLTAVTLTAKYRSSAASGTAVGQRWLRATPVRVG